jgi:hypothetical protein
LRRLIRDGLSIHDAAERVGVPYLEARQLIRAAEVADKRLEPTQDTRRAREPRRSSARRLILAGRLASRGNRYRHRTLSLAELDAGRSSGSSAKFDLVRYGAGGCSMSEFGDNPLSMESIPTSATRALGV